MLKADSIKYINILVILSLNCTILSAGSGGLDSLKNELKNAKYDSIKIDNCIKIGDIKRNAEPDSALLYYGRAFKIAEQAMKKDAENREKYVLYQALSLRLKGLTYLLNGENANSRNYLQNALKLYKSISASSEKKNALEAEKGMAKCYSNFGMSYKNTGEYSIAIEYFDKSIKMSYETGDKKTTSIALNGKGIVYYYTGEYEKSVKAYTEAAGIFADLNDLSSMSAALSNAGLVYTAQGLYVNAIESYNEALKTLEQAGDTTGIASCYNNIGLVYYEQRSYEKALDYYRKSLSVSQKNSNKSVRASNYNNIGNVYSDIADYDRALENYFLSLGLREELNDKYNLTGLYNNIGLIYYYKEDYSSALQYYSKSYAISEEMSDKSNMAKVLGNLSALYLKLAEQPGGERGLFLKKALDDGLRSYDLAVEIGAIPVQNTTAGQLQRAYTIMGKFKEALQFAEVVIYTKDSMFSDEKVHVMAEVNARYEAERKELQIENLNKENKLNQVLLEKSETQRSKQKILIYSFIAGLIIVLAFSFTLLRLFVQKKKANVLLARQKEQIENKNNLLEQANEEIHTQKDEIEAQRDMVISQKSYIEEQQKEIVDSINYARRIQYAVLPTGSRADEMLGKHFIFFRPRNVVSGDFYWVSKVKMYLVIAVADCTGHGVPGAFMSMMGIGLLNEIVRKEEVRNAADVLNHMRELLVKSLNQDSFSVQKDVIQNYQFSKDITTSTDIVVKDGMDISLLIINTDTMRCFWAGAYNPLYIVRSRQLTVGSEGANCQLPTATCQLTELKADKMPVAVHYKMTDFTNHEFGIEKGDRVYLFSDGFYDQFGGKEGKKMGMKVFRNLLERTSSFPIKEQGSEVAAFFEKWITANGTRYNQVDDITVLGIEI